MGLGEDDQAAVGTGVAVQRNGSPVVHMRWRITASLRATAMVAFLEPMRLARARPQACKSLGLADRLSSTLAASNNSPTLLSRSAGARRRRQGRPSRQGVQHSSVSRPHLDGGEHGGR